MKALLGSSCRLAVLVGLLIPLTASADHPITEYPLKANGGRPQGIAAGSDGNLWVTLVIKKPGVLRVTPSGQVTEFPVPTAKVGVLQGIAPGSDGNLWITSREENSLRKITVAGQFDGEFKIPTMNSLPAGN